MANVRFTRLGLVAETQRELRMRVKVWQTIRGTTTPDGNPVFVSLEQQDQYNRLAEVHRILEKMTNAEFLNLLNAIEAREASTGNQQQLF